MRACSSAASSCATVRASAHRPRHTFRRAAAAVPAAAARRSAARLPPRSQTSTAAWNPFNSGRAAAEVPASDPPVDPTSSEDEGAPIEEEKEEQDPLAPQVLLDVDENTTGEAHLVSNLTRPLQAALCCAPWRPAGASSQLNTSLSCGLDHGDESAGRRCYCRRCHHHHQPEQHHHRCWLSCRCSHLLPAGAVAELEVLMSNIDRGLLLLKPFTLVSCHCPCSLLCCYSDRAGGADEQHRQGQAQPGASVPAQVHMEERKGVPPD